MKSKIINIMVIIIVIRCDMTNTTISITQQTKKALLDLGTKGETYDNIVRKLIKRHAWKKMDERWNKILAEDEFIPLEEL